ncbi:hypothetical protein FRB95_011699 [Tulasnella sp. JGI-2019a]|nr:hypothetical protein FRB95_011699 [Tulasnella sp. JGI-2019a]
MQFDEASITLIATLLERFGGRFGDNLISLDWSYDIHNDDCTGTLIDLFPGTRLQEIDFRSEEQFHLAGTSSSNPLSQLAHRAPHISQLENVHDSFDFSVFPRLRYLLHRGSLSTSDYHNLSCCQDLAVLFLRWTEGQVTPFHGTDTTFPRLERFVLYSPDDEAEEMVIRSVMPALRFLTYSKRRAMGPFTVPLLNNILRTSPLLEKISITVAVTPSQLELVQHHGVRNLSFHGLYRLRSPLDLLAVSRFFPKLEKLTVFFDRTRWPHCRQSTWHWNALPALVDQLRHLQYLTIPLHVPVSSLSGTPKETTPLQSLISLKFQVLYIRRVDIDPFVTYLAMLFPEVHSIEVKVLFEVPDEGVDGMDFVLGDSRAFVNRFFRYRGQIRGSQISDGGPVEEIH